MEIDNKGKILSAEIFPSYIKSRKKMTYKKVNDILMSMLLLQITNHLKTL